MGLGDAIDQMREWRDVCTVNSGLPAKLQELGACDRGGGGGYSQWSNWIGLQLVVETTDNGCETPPFPPFFLAPSSLPAACLVLDGWRRRELQVGSD